MPTSIKLTYFDARGRAETSRLILAYAGVDYQDERITGLFISFYEYLALMIFITKCDTFMFKESSLQCTTYVSLVIFFMNILL